MPRRKPGRPQGSKAQVVQDARALGIHHFAFVRSSILGLDLAESFDRYLAWAETTTDLRYVQNRREALLKRIIEAGRQIDATLPAHSKITPLLDLLCSDAAPPKAVALPTLNEWIESEGIRLDELAKARHKDLRIEALPDLPETWILSVTGKRNKTREVPLKAEVVGFWPCMARSSWKRTSSPATKTSCH